jgi:hypothetical protein
MEISWEGKVLLRIARTDPSESAISRHHRIYQKAAQGEQSHGSWRGNRARAISLGFKQCHAMFRMLIVGQCEWQPAPYKRFDTAARLRTRCQVVLATENPTLRDLVRAQRGHGIVVERSVPSVFRCGEGQS